MEYLPNLIRTALVFSALVTPALAQTRPNIVLILTDDMGYADLRRYGDSEIPTPQIDRIADEGVWFEQAYVTAPVCVPSRMGLITGKYQQRFGIYDNAYSAEECAIWKNEKTIADRLQDAGYATALVGKWHLSGNNRAFRNKLTQPWNFAPPHERGFSEFVGISGGMSNFFGGEPLIRLEDGQYRWFEAPEYLTDFFGKEASAFIERNRARPFFLFLSLNAPHAPLQALPEDEAAIDANWVSPARKTYGGMVRAIDRNVGRVLDTLDALKLRENTIVIFLNDNGGDGNNAAVYTRNAARNAPYRGYKFDVWEGGLRIPMYIRFPKRIPPGSRFTDVVSSMDIAPTLVAAAGLEPLTADHYDGVNLFPFLEGHTNAAPYKFLCWQQATWSRPNERELEGYGHQAHSLENIYQFAIRRGPWKAVRQDQFFFGQGSLTDRPWELYDLARDPGEQHDVAAEYPEITAEMAELFSQWQLDMTPPLVREKIKPLP